jgi:hypothetical protein
MILELWSGPTFETTFVLEPTPSPSLEVVSYSRVPWKKLRMEGFTADNDRDSSIKSCLHSFRFTVTSLEICNSTVSWGWIQGLIGSFEFLDKLSIVGVTQKEKRCQAWFQTLEELKRFNEFQGRLVSLTLSSDKVRSLSFFVRKIVGKDLPIFSHLS